MNLVPGLLLIVCVICQSIVTAPKAGKRKNHVASCPDTCKLRKRLAKFEASTEKKLATLEMQLRKNESSPESRVSSDDAQRVVEALRNELSNELNAMFEDGRSTITSLSEQVEELIRSIPVQVSHLVSARGNAERNDSPNTPLLIESMNRTLEAVTRQNALLTRKCEESTNLANVIRQQNAILSSQNTKLRLHNQRSNIKRRETQALVRKLEARFDALNSSLADRQSGRPDSHPGGRVSEERLGAIGKSIEGVLSSAEEALDRVQRLESWASELVETQTGFPPLIPVTTSHPQPDVPPVDCQALYNMGFRTSGVYLIRPWQSQSSFNVYCEQSYYQGGWTVIQRRRDGSENFDRDWDEYAQGFGDLDSEFWLGNENIHHLTNQNSYLLHIVLADFNGSRTYAEYEGFRLSSSRDYYSLRFGAYYGTAGDALRGTAEDGSRNLYLARFSTRDLDNDQCSPCQENGRGFTSCAQLQRGGWWYRACADANLNGRYVEEDALQRCGGELCRGLQWRTWQDDVDFSLRASQMMVKPLGAEQGN